jgi:MFS family permease
VARNLAPARRGAIVRADDGRRRAPRKNGRVTTTDASPDRAPHARVTLLVLTALSALAFMDRQILAVLLVPVKAEFALTDLQAGLVTGLGFALTFGLIGVPLGRVADRRERRRLVAWCRGIGGAMAALGAGAGSAWTLALARAGTAVSDAGGAPASMSMIADLYPPHQRSRAMSVFTLGASLGSLLALVGGAWLAQRHGWRLTLATIGGASLLGALALRWGTREPVRGRWGTAASAAPPSRPGQGAVAAVWAEPVARWLIVAATFALLAGYSFGVWNFAYLMRAYGLSSTQAGAVTGLSALGSLVGGVVSGGLTDRLVRRDPRWQMGVPIVGIAAALPAGAAYLALGAGPIAPVVALVTVFSFFIAFWIAPTYAALSLVVVPQRRAVASAMVMIVGAVGGSGVGPVLTGALSDAFAGRVDGDPLRPALAVMLALLLLAIASLARAMRAYGARQAPSHRVAPA